MTRAFRFGVFGENARTPEALLGTARQAEQAGYATFLIRDHFIEEPFGHQLAPLTALATVAAATTSLRVGSLVLSNDYRHPAMLAKEIATLDALSGYGEGHTFNFAPDLARVRCPTLVLGGEDDPMTPIECQADIAAALPADLVRFERFPGCGHAILPDAPERALTMIREFVAR
jgi:pimeloyl-ACP methyl ester carboxylesterase